MAEGPESGVQTRGVQGVAGRRTSDESEKRQIRGDSTSKITARWKSLLDKVLASPGLRHASQYVRGELAGEEETPIREKCEFQFLKYIFIFSFLVYFFNLLSLLLCPAV